MMKWGRRRRKTSSASSSSSASGPSFTSHAFFSWLSKFKHMRIDTSEPNHGNMKHKAKLNSTPVSSPQDSCGNVGGYYVGDGNALRRSSFGEEIHDHEDKKSEDIDDENYVIPSSSFPTGRRNANKKHETREDTHLKFKEKDIGLGGERKSQDDRKVISQEMDECNREKEYEHLRSRFERKAQRALQEQLLKLERTEEGECASEKDVLMQLESPRTICAPRTHSSFASFADSSISSNFKVKSIVDFYEKAGRLQSQKKSSSPERKNLKQTEELKVKTNNKKRQQTLLDVIIEPQRMRKPKQHSPRLRIYSPRMASKVEVCRIKAMQDMRKAKQKMKRLQREEVVEEIQGPDHSLAVIKCSLDPKQDFRDSIVEMIMEKQIRHPEEMEELLACYLALNADEYHDLIIRVFRQVWFDVSQDGLGIKSDMQCSCREM